MATRRILKTIRLAKQGDVEAQLALGECYLTGGEGLAANLPTAYRWLAAAADQGLAKAAWLIGEHIPPAAVDGVQRAKTYYELAERDGSAAAATVLARWRLAGELGQLGANDRGLAHQSLRTAAEAGHLAAQLELGSMAADGEAAGGDLVWLERAAERGERQAMEKLVVYYWALAGGDLWSDGQTPGLRSEGRSPEALAAARQALAWHEAAWRTREKDMPSAEVSRRACLLLLDHQNIAGKWLERAALAGERTAAYLLGLLYMGPSYVNGMAVGAGIPAGRWFSRSYKQAERWLVLAAEAGLAEAAFALWLLGGIRGYTQRDPVVARLRLHQAAEAGHPEACWQVGNEALRRAENVAALRWWLRASERGHADAARALDRLAPDVALPDAELLGAALAMRNCDVVMALRLELAAHFHLLRHEFLLIDPASADAGDFLVVDVRQGFGKAKRHLLRISRPAQREALDRARFGIASGGLLAGNYRALLRRFKLLCAKAGIPQVAR